MDLVEKKRIEDLKRAEKNRDLIERMKAGENLALYDPCDTFFPPRPLVVKDRDAIRRLYDGSERGKEEIGARETGEVGADQAGELSRD